MISIFIKLKTIDLITDNKNEDEVLGYISLFMKNKGFKQLDNNLFIDESNKLTPVDAVMLTQELDKKYNWLFLYVDDIKLLKINSIDDLMPALSVK